MPSMPTSASLPVITSPRLALHHTRFSNWFPLYRRHSPKATIIDLLTLQPDFVDWLEEDGLILPRHSDEEQEKELGSDSDESDSDDEDAPAARDFDSLNERIRQVISSYEGAVFPKLDWSAPSDAAWIVPGSSLRCTTPSDVYLLLKSSDFVSKDINQLRELEVMKRSISDEVATLSSPVSIRPVLILKKYFTIPTSHEFRCFVRAGKLICISQRDTGTYFDHLREHSTQLQIKRMLQKFYNDVLSTAIEESSMSISAPSRRVPFPINDFVWDAYISRDMSKVFLMDINPFLERTDGLLWTWPEVEEMAEKRLNGEDESDDEDFDEDDNDEEDGTIMRIFTDGREPILIRPNGEMPKLPAASPRTPLPRLRTVTSRAQTTQSFPTYGRNMIPSDVVGAAEGNNIADFAREWNRKIAHAAVDEVDGNEDDGDDDDDEEEVMNMPAR